MKIILALLITVQMCSADTNRTVSIIEPNPQSETTNVFRTATKNESLVVTHDYVTDRTPIEWAKLCLQYLKLVYIATGFISNGFVFAVFYRRNKTKRASANIYLMALSLSDSLACFVINVFAYGAQFGLNMTVYRGTDCILTPLFVGQLPIVMSNLIIMVLCFERCIAIFAPMRSQMWFTVKRAHVMVGLMVLLVAVANWPSFGGYTAFTQEDIDNGYPPLAPMYRYCKGRFPTVTAYARGWQKVQGVVLFLVLPIASAVFCNVLIVGKVCLNTSIIKTLKFKGRRNQHYSVSDSEQQGGGDTIECSVSAVNRSDENKVSFVEEGNSHTSQKANQPTIFLPGKPSSGEGIVGHLSNSSTNLSSSISGQNMNAPVGDKADDGRQLFTITDKVDSSRSNEPSLGNVDASRSIDISSEKMVDPKGCDHPGIVLQSTSLSRHQSFITRVCLVVSTELLIFSAVLYLASLFGGPRVVEDPDVLAGADGLRAVALSEALHLLLSLHHSASNLILYTVFVPTFRRDLKKLCC